MDIWLQSRLFSFFIIAEFFLDMAQFAAIRHVTVKPYVRFSEFVDIVDSNFPLSVLLFYEILLHVLVVGFLFLVLKLVKKDRFSLRAMLGGYGKALFWIGVYGLISRVLMSIDYIFFMDREMIRYDALGISFGRDAGYLLSGILLHLAVKYIPASWRKKLASTLSGRGMKTVLAVLFVLSLCLNFYVIVYFDMLHEEKQQISDELAVAQEEVSTLQQEKANFDKTLLKEKHKYTELYYEKIALEKVIRFFDEHIALVVEDGSNLYHTYDCKVFQDARTFWASNVNAAEGDGYKPCGKCH